MKIVNVVLGIATALILGALINLGIAAFYPAPAAPSYPNTPVVPCASADAKCITADSAASAAAQDQWNAAETVYEAQMGVYDRNLFIIANIVGIIVFAIGFLIIFGTSIGSIGAPIGMMLAGLWAIIYGYARGWGSVDDRLKFAIGLALAILVIGGSMWLMQRYDKKRSARQ